MEQINEAQSRMPREIPVDDSLALRWLVLEDSTRIWEIFTVDPDIQKRVTWMHELTSETDVADRIHEFQQSGSLRYGIVKEGRLVGYVGMWQDRGYMTGVTPEDEYGFGYFLDAAERGKGITARATAALMASAEAVFNVKTWAVYCEDDNKPSQAVLKSLGFTAADQTFDEPTMHTIERRWQKVLEV